MVGLLLRPRPLPTSLLDPPPPRHPVKCQPHDAPQELWTGKQLFGLLLRPNASVGVWVNLELPEREYSKSGAHMCPKDG